MRVLTACLVAASVWLCAAAGAQTAVLLTEPPEPGTESLPQWMARGACGGAGLFAVWAETLPDGDAVFAKNLLRSGPGFRLQSPPTYGPQLLPQVSSGDSSAVVFWVEFAAPAPSRLMARRVGADGAPQGVLHLVTDAFSSAGFSVVAVGDKHVALYSDPAGPAMRAIGADDVLGPRVAIDPPPSPSPSLSSYEVEFRRAASDGSSILALWSRISNPFPTPLESGAILIPPNGSSAVQIASFAMDVVWDGSSYLLFSESDIVRLNAAGAPIGVSTVMTQIPDLLVGVVWNGVEFLVRTAGAGIRSEIGLHHISRDLHLVGSETLLLPERENGDAWIVGGPECRTTLLYDARPARSPYLGASRIALFQLVDEFSAIPTLTRPALLAFALMVAGIAVLALRV